MTPFMKSTGLTICQSCRQPFFQKASEHVCRPCELLADSFQSLPAPQFPHPPISKEGNSCTSGNSTDGREISGGEVTTSPLATVGSSASEGALTHCQTQITQTTPGLGSNGEDQQERDGYKLGPVESATRDQSERLPGGADSYGARVAKTEVIPTTVGSQGKTGYVPAEINRQVPSPTDESSSRTLDAEGGATDGPVNEWEQAAESFSRGHLPEIRNALMAAFLSGAEFAVQKCKEVIE